MSEHREESAFNMFKQMDLKGKSKDDTQLKTVHQNTITTLREHGGSPGAVKKISSKSQHHVQGGYARFNRSQQAVLMGELSSGRSELYQLIGIKLMHLWNEKPILRKQSTNEINDEQPDRLIKYDQTVKLLFAVPALIALLFIPGLIALLVIRVLVVCRVGECMTTLRLSSYGKARQPHQYMHQGKRPALNALLVDQLKADWDHV